MGNADPVEVLQSRAGSADSIIDAVLQTEEICEYYFFPLGGKDNITLLDHTTRVIECYDRYFFGKVGLALTDRDIRILLALHDVGKPLAVRAGDSRLQHLFTKMILRDLSRLSHSSLLDIIIEFSCVDPIGGFLNKKNALQMEDALRELRHVAQRTGLPLSETWDIFHVYFQCDAAGYPSLRQKVFACMEDGSLQWDQGSKAFYLNDPIERRRLTELRDNLLGN